MATGGGVFQVTDLMLAYHFVAFEGSPAKAETTSREQAIVVTTCTSTGMTPFLPARDSPRAREPVLYLADPSLVHAGERRPVACSRGRARPQSPQPIGNASNGAAKAAPSR